MACILRLRKLLYLAPSFSLKDTAQLPPPPPQPPRMERAKRWGCVDWCLWVVGYVCTTWWLLLFLYAILPSTFIPTPEQPGVRLRHEGLHALHPVVFVPGIVTGGLELWEGRPCGEGLFRKRLWGGSSFTEIFKRPLCWMEHMSLDNETGLDPPGIRVRSVPGLVAVDYFVWARLIENLAKIGYEGKNMHMTAYDWRLSFHNTEKLVRTDNSPISKSSCGGVWTEYRELSMDDIKKVTENKVYTARTIHDLLHFVAPKLMQRADTHFSYGIADNLDDPKYSDQKYWSNPLETRLPSAPEMEMYCLYGVGIPTERSYVYKLSPSDRCNNIPFQIDGSADGGSDGCLKRGVFLTDGDQSVPVLSAGLMCAKAWRGKTRFNPSGMPTYVREYQHKPPANLFHGRGYESGAHVDIMGNTALIEDIMRVAAGASGAEVGGDKIHSDISKISERIKLKL